MPEPAYKRCTKCGETKPIAEFYRNKRRGRVERKAQCRMCQRAAERVWERNNPRRNENLKLRRGKWPEKERARKMIAKRLERGSMVKPNRCEDCGGEFSGRGIQGHHDDYSKPLEVRWLCQRCHRAVHAAEEAALAA